MGWTLKTSDTTLTIEAGEHCPVITQLSGTIDYNWAIRPTEMLFPKKMAVGTELVDHKWVLADTHFEQNDEFEKLTLLYKSDKYNITLTSTWTAYNGPGAIRHGMIMSNRTGQSIVVYNPESLDIEVSASESPVDIFYVCKNRLAPRIIPSFQCSYGTYTEKLNPRSNAHIWTTVDGSDTGYIPLVMLHADKKHGIYVGWEWNEGRISVTGRQKSDALYAGITAGLDIDFCTELPDGEDFIVPNAFIGAFSGSLDDGSNRLRKWLFNHMMPEQNRINESIPYVQWNAFENTAVSKGSWFCEEKNYYKMMDSIAEAGVEEVTIDIGWWQDFGDYRSNSERWPRGMAAASEYAHKHNMLFTLYFAFLEGESEDPLAITQVGPNGHPEWIAPRWMPDMTIPECHEFMKKMILQRLNEYNVDTLRSDLSPIPRTKAPGNKHQGCHDQPYWAQKAYLEFLDYLLENKPGLRYQNCNCGSALIGYEIMKRTTCIQITDIYTALDMRRAIWDAVYCYPLMQLMTQFGDVTSDKKLGTPSYRFRSYLMGYPSIHIEMPSEMSEDERNTFKRLIATFKSRVRPLIRYADVYHVLPRPDGINWDGLQLYDPERGKGMVSAFRPDNDIDEIKIRLEGLDQDAQYSVEYDDKSLENTVISGSVLMDEGLRVCLPEKFSAEWIFITKV